MHLPAASSCFVALACLAALVLPADALAQSATFPQRAVRLVVPFAAGGPADSVARTVAPALDRALGQPVVVENRPGADGAIGAQSVLSAPADGHTLLLASASLVPLALARHPPPFDLRRDFAPVSKISPAPWALYVTPQLAARTVPELVAHARAHPGQLNVATSTLTDELAAAQFMKATDTSLVKVKYKGAGQAMPDLVAGRVHVNLSPVSALGLQLARSGQVRLMAVLSPVRNPMAPDVPTLAEAGVPGVTASGWLALLAPARTPADVVARLQSAAAAALADAHVRAQLHAQGVVAEASTPEALARLIDDDLRTWAAYAREAGGLGE